MAASFPASLLVPGAAAQPVELSMATAQADGASVSCLMVSRGNLFPARFAVECFLRQTHPDRELVVVLDDPACELGEHLRDLCDPRIRIVDPPPGHATLGELRNLAVATARGEFICQWDDDDLYAPERIACQLSALAQTGANACLLRRWTLWWPGTRRLAVSGARLWEGSILARRQAMRPYPALRRGEDTEMVEALLGRERVVALDAPELYVYVRHGTNAFAEPHFA